MNHLAAHNVSRYQLWHSFRDSATSFNCPLDDTELRKLYKRIRDSDGDERDISGPWHRTKKESTTYPSDTTSRTDSADRYGEYRLTPIRCDENTISRRKDGLKHPVRPAEMMCGNLGLPALPAHHTFCYYVNRAWVFNKLSKSHPGAMEMTPLMRAAALEWVEIF